MIRGVITQNIDHLHQQGGSRVVVELHGTAIEIECQDCKARFPADPWVRKYLEDQRVPTCPNCGKARMKHATISFGQGLNEDVLAQAIRYARDCDLLLVLGSSLVVEPAASLPRLAAAQGARLVIINREPTPLDHLASANIRAGIGETLIQIDSALSRLRGMGESQTATP